MESVPRRLGLLHLSNRLWWAATLSTVHSLVHLDDVALSNPRTDPATGQHCGERESAGLLGFG